MTVQQVTDLQMPIGKILEAAGAAGLVLDAGGQVPYAIVPLDDDLLDYLLERNPKFIEACHGIRDRMRAGEFQTHEQVKKLMAGI